MRNEDVGGLAFVVAGLAAIVVITGLALWAPSSRPASTTPEPMTPAQVTRVEAVRRGMPIMAEITDAETGAPITSMEAMIALGVETKPGRMEGLHYAKTTCAHGWVTFQDNKGCDRWLVVIHATGYPVLMLEDTCFEVTPTSFLARHKLRRERR